MRNKVLDVKFARQESKIGEQDQEQEELDIHLEIGLLELEYLKIQKLHELAIIKRTYARHNIDNIIVKLNNSNANELDKLQDVYDLRMREMERADASVEDRTEQMENIILQINELQKNFHYGEDIYPKSEKEAFDEVILSIKDGNPKSRLRRG